MLNILTQQFSLHHDPLLILAAERASYFFAHVCHCHPNTAASVMAYRRRNKPPIKSKGHSLETISTEVDRTENAFRQVDSSTFWSEFFE
jgi:hypothetical protein